MTGYAPGWPNWRRKMAYNYRPCPNCGKLVGEMAEHEIEDCVSELQERIERLEAKVENYYGRIYPIYRY